MSHLAYITSRELVERLQANAYLCVQQSSKTSSCKFVGMMEFRSCMFIIMCEMPEGVNFTSGKLIHCLAREVCLRFSAIEIVQGPMNVLITVLCYGRGVLNQTRQVSELSPSSAEVRIEKNLIYGRNTRMLPATTAVILLLSVAWLAYTVQNHLFINLRTVTLKNLNCKTVLSDRLVETYLPNYHCCCKPPLMHRYDRD